MILITTLLIVMVLTAAIAQWRVRKEWLTIVIIGIGTIAIGLANQTLPHRIVNVTMVLGGLAVVIIGFVRRQKDSKRARLDK